MNSYENSSIYKWLNGEVPTKLETGFYAVFILQEDNQPVYWARVKGTDAKWSKHYRFNKYEDYMK